MLLDAFSLAGRTAIITGAGKGIGRCVAESFAEMGANIVCVARTQADVDAVAERAREQGAQSLAIAAEVTRESELRAVVEQTMQQFQGIDIVVNNAGGGGKGYGSLAEVNMAGFEDELQVNLSSAYALCHLCLPHLKQSSCAAIVNVSSALSWMVDKKFAAYGAAKAGMNQMTRVLAYELAPDIRVNAIAPGAVATAATEFITNDQNMLAATERWIPMRRIGQPIDIALAALYFASDASSFVSGKILEVDGGMQALPGGAIEATIAELAN